MDLHGHCQRKKLAVREAPTTFKRQKMSCDGNFLRLLVSMTLHWSYFRMNPSANPRTLTLFNFFKKRKMSEGRNISNHASCVSSFLGVSCVILSLTNGRALEQTLGRFRVSCTHRPLTRFLMAAISSPKYQDTRSTHTAKATTVQVVVSRLGPETKSRPISGPDQAQRHR